jgi:uncharacterized protein YjbI with pentapeptide repeats
VTLLAASLIFLVTSWRIPSLYDSCFCHQVESTLLNVDAQLENVELSTKSDKWSDDDTVSATSPVKGANLKCANLRNAHAYRAFLVKADLERTYCCSADFREADLRFAHLDGADLTGADFRGAHLCKTVLKNAQLRKAQFGNADLDGADFTGADLTQTNFRNVYTDDKSASKTDGPALNLKIDQIDAAKSHVGILLPDSLPPASNVPNNSPGPRTAKSGFSPK